MAKINKEKEEYFLGLIREGVFQVVDGYIERNGKRYTNPGVDEYICVKVRVGNRVLKAYAHRLIYRTLVGDIPDGMIVNHIDGNKTNNHISNFELLTTRGNTIHALQAGLVNSSPVSKEIVIQLRSEFEQYEGSMRKFARDNSARFGLAVDSVRNILLRRTWDHV